MLPLNRNLPPTTFLYSSIMTVSISKDGISNGYCQNLAHFYQSLILLSIYSMSKPVVTACIRLRIAAQQAKPSAAIGQVKTVLSSNHY